MRREVIHIRLSPEIATALRVRAKQESRTVSAMAELLLKATLAARPKKEKAG